MNFLKKEAPQDNNKFHLSNLRVRDCRRTDPIELKTEEEYRMLIGEKAFITIKEIFFPRLGQLDLKVLKIVAAIKSLMDSNATPHSALVAKVAQTVNLKPKSHAPLNPLNLGFNSTFKSEEPVSQKFSREAYEKNKTPTVRPVSSSKIPATVKILGDDRIQTVATRFNEKGQPVISGNDDNILALVYLLASKGIEYGGDNGANPTQSTSAYSAILFDECYQQALGLFISYVNGEKDYAERRRNLKTANWKGEITPLQDVADALNETPPEEGARYCTSQIFQMLANLKSYANFPLTESDPSDLGAIDANNPQRQQEIEKLQESLQELHDMFVHLSTIIDIYCGRGLKMQEVAHNTAVDAAEGLANIRASEYYERKARGETPSWGTVEEAQERALNVAEEKKTVLSFPTFFDRGKDRTDRAYHDKCNWDDENKLLSDNIVELMKDYFSNGKGLFRSHKKDAQIILDRIARFSANDKNNPERLYFMVLDQLRLSGEADKSDKPKPYSAFRARCIYILNELQKKMAKQEGELEKELPPSLLSWLKNKSSTQEMVNSYHLPSREW